jgi:hypothetical protein
VVVALSKQVSKLDFKKRDKKASSYPFLDLQIHARHKLVQALLEIICNSVKLIFASNSRVQLRNPCSVDFQGSMDENGLDEGR